MCRRTAESIGARKLTSRVLGKVAGAAVAAVLVISAALYLNMYTFLTPNIVGYLEHIHITPEEGKVGKIPLFSTQKEGWARYPIEIPGKAIWGSLGEGMYYYLSPSPKKYNWTERFNPDSPLYQAGVVAYFIYTPDGRRLGFAPGGEPDPAQLMRVVADSREYFLRLSGDDSPLAVPSDEYTLGTVNLGDRRVWYFETHLKTHSDLHDAPSPSFLYNALWGVPDVALWGKKVVAHHDISLPILHVFWYDGEMGATVGLYGMGAEYTPIDGEAKISTFEKIREDLVEIISGVRWVDLARK
ncbi:MAG: hypothetical protein ACUVXI_17225 [bacterium]